MSSSLFREEDAYPYRIDISQPPEIQSYPENMIVPFSDLDSKNTYMPGMGFDGAPNLYPYPEDTIAPSQASTSFALLPAIHYNNSDLNQKYDTLVALGCTAEQAFQMLTGATSFLGADSPMPQYEPRVRLFVPDPVTNQEDLLFNYFSVSLLVEFLNHKSLIYVHVQRVSTFQYIFDKSSSVTMQNLVIKS